MSDLQRAYDALTKKERYYDRLWRYYDGNQPLRYSTDRLEKVFKSLNARFTQNWCQVIVDSVLERMEFKQFQVTGDDGATQVLNLWWLNSEMYLDADDVELCALVTGESMVIIWPGDDGMLEAYFNDSRMCHVFYDAENPRRIAFAVKWWEIEEKRTRLTIYYPDRLEYYQASKPIKELTNATAFQPYLQDETDVDSWWVENPLGIVPVWHFRRERRAIKSELGPSVLDGQDAINKLLNDMMVASEYGAYKQRWIISQADVGALKNSPDEIWDLPAGDGLGQGTAVGEFNETPLENFLNGMEQLATGLSKQTRTPQYYFFLGARADPSGETLMAMDAPLVKKTEAYIKRFKREWYKLGLFVAGYFNLPVPMDALKVVYADPRTIQPKTEAETRKTDVESGIPLRTTLRRAGWTPKELAEMAEDQAEERAAAQQSMAVAMLEARRNFDQGAGQAAGQNGAGNGAV